MWCDCLRGLRRGSKASGIPADWLTVAAASERRTKPVCWAEIASNRGGGGGWGMTGGGVDASEESDGYGCLKNALSSELLASSAGEAVNFHCAD